MFMKIKNCLIKGIWVVVIGVIISLPMVSISYAAEDSPLSMKSSHAVREALVIINADTIYATDLDSAIIKFHSGVDQKSREQFDYRKLLNKLVNDRLLVQEARNVGIDQEEWLIAQMQKIRRDYAVRRYISDTFKPNADVSDSAVMAYFLANYDKVQIRMLSVRTLDEANNLIVAIKQGASMDSIAKAISLDTYKFQGGLHGLQYRVAVEEYLREHVLKLKKGQLSAPFRNQQAYSFMRLEESLPADTMELPDLKETITRILKTKQTEAAWKLFIQDLQNKFPVVTDSVRLRKIQADSSLLYTQDFIKGTADALFYADNINKITDEEFRKILSKAAMSARNQSFETMLTNSIDRIREQVVLTAAADKADYENNTRVVAAYRKSLDSALIEAYLKETIVSQITFTHAELETYYKENQERYRESEQLLVDRMTIKDSTRAQEAARRLADGADFDYLIKQFADEIKLAIANESNDWKPLEIFPSPIDTDISKLEIGQITKPYLTNEGWMFFRIKGRREGKIKPQADVEMDIKGALFQRKFDSILDNVMNKLKANSNIEYKENSIEKYFGK